MYLGKLKFMLPGDYIAFKFSGKVNSTVCGLSEVFFGTLKIKKYLRKF